jgi:hypothetical protein
MPVQRRAGGAIRELGVMGEPLPINGPYDAIADRMRGKVCLVTGGEAVSVEPPR